MVTWGNKVFGRFIQNGLKMTRSNELRGVEHHLFNMKKEVTLGGFE